MFYMNELTSNPRVIGRLETESRWTRPLRSWPEARDFARHNLVEQGAELGASMIVFDRAEVEESDNHITVRMFAIAWSGETAALAREVERTDPGAVVALS